MANPVELVMRPVDRWQQRHAATAFVFGVVKKTGDDRGGMLAGLVTFYGFLSTMPLLLVLVTVAGFFPSIQSSVQHSALTQIPVIGPQLRVKALHGNTFALVFGIASLLWGALGVSQAVQFAINEAWGVPGKDRPPFLPRVIRGMAFFAVLGAGIVGTTVLTALGSIVGNSLAAGIGGLAAAVVVNSALFLGIFLVLGPKENGWRDHLPGAILGGVGWQLLQTLGAQLVQHNYKRLDAAYSQFALALGLISFLSLASQLLMYSVEVNVVRSRRLWPRSIVQPPLLPADRETLAMRAITQQIRPEQEVSVDWKVTGPAQAQVSGAEAHQGEFPAKKAAAIAAASLGAAMLDRRRRR